jgi:hypothetical protein
MFEGCRAERSIAEAAVVFGYILQGKEGNRASAKVGDRHGTCE